MYKIGDRVVYPMHGAGTIVGVETKEILGEERDYLILAMPIGNIRISIPIDNLDSIGIRSVMSKEEGQEVLEILRQESSRMSSNWSQRYRDNMESLKTGSPVEMAKIVRNLQLRDIEKGLSTSEKKMLNSSKRMLVSELIIAGSMTKEEAMEMIDDAILDDEDA
uniref:CarD family transcriptional regulator n=1 Tax=Ndongobacter massiliensis TaxID=1871025 RepID=UPI0009312EAF|nr:CarD family transcriptional regulator [Ndongobacter massiliensis]